MPSLSQCSITGTLYDVNGDTVPANTRVTIVKTVKSGQVIMHTPDWQPTNSSGVVVLTAPRASTISVYAKAVGLEENGPIVGVDLAVPNTATANLEDLISVASVPSTGLTIKDEGTALASLIGTFDFVGSGVAVTQTSSGVAQVSITAGSGVTLREVDGAPSLAASTVEFAQASGFVVTDQTGGVGRVDVLAIPVNKLAALTASRVPVTDGSGFLSVSAVTATTLGFLDASSSIQTQLNAKQGTLTNSAGLLAALSDETGTGLAVFNDTPTFISPLLGTPTSGTLTNCTLPVGGLTGLGANVGTFLATPSSANLISAVTGETGTGGLVFADTPTLIAPLLGTPTSGVLTNATGLPPTTGIVGWPANASGVLTNNGSGALSWAAAGGGTPGGANTQVQFNDSSAFGGDAQFTFNKTSGLTTITAAAATGAAAFQVSPGSGASFTRINDNGTVVIDADSGTGSVPLQIKYNGSQIASMSFGGSWTTVTLALTAATGGMTLGSGNAGVFYGGSAGIVHISNGNVGEWGSLKVGTRDAGTTTVTNGLTLGHQSTGTPAAGFGSAVLFNINSSTTADQEAGQIAALWTTATHASRTADMVFYTVNNAAAKAEAGRFTGAKDFNVIGALLTADPTSGVGPLWKLGARKAATVALDTTQYIEVNVAGTTYKVGIVV